MSKVKEYFVALLGEHGLARQEFHNYTLTLERMLSDHVVAEWHRRYPRRIRLDATGTVDWTRARKSMGPYIDKAFSSLKTAHDPHIRRLGHRRDALSSELKRVARYIRFSPSGFCCTEVTTEYDLGWFSTGGHDDVRYRADVAAKIPYDVAHQQRSTGETVMVRRSWRSGVMDECRPRYRHLWVKGDELTAAHLRHRQLTYILEDRFGLPY